MSMPYTDDDIEDEVEIESVEEFEIEGNNIVLDVSGGDIKLSDGDAKTLTGVEALKQWIEKVFQTRANVYPIYDIPKETTEDEEEDDTIDVYGSEVRDILLDPDMDWEEKTADIQLNIEDVLSRHPDVISTSNFVFTQEGRTLIVTFDLASVYGEEQQEVVINGENG